ncbi:MAG: rhodanese-related sulfurtransferase [Micrococcales bacterium]|nr:rhodanese-related sulfurtransferase [Micrococcales bacterium]
MAINKIILYYGFAPVADPKAVMLWQKTLCQSLNLKGRILISKHGINGTLGGDMEDLKKYARATKEYPGFGKIDFKWSDGLGDDFPKLSVKVRKELVAFTTPEEVKVEKSGVVNGGKHLKPQQVNELVAERGDDVVFFDGRNAFEAKIGKFKNAIVPDVQTTHDFVAELESGKYDHLKDKPIVTYCTGGIRCEILSAVMLNRGFKEVYQIQGGIVRYGEKYRDKGLWEGSLYVFDKRMTHNFSDEALTIGECENCSGPTSSFRNCQGAGCKDLVLLCDSCFTDPANLKCSDTHTRGRQKLQEIG